MYIPRIFKFGDEFLQNSLTSLSGFALPSLLALLTWRVLLSQIGPDRLGIVSLAWTVLGFSSLFDFGLGRSLTRAVSEVIQHKDNHHVVSLFWSAEFVMVSLGSCAMLITLVAQSFGALHITLGSQTLNADAEASLAWVAIGIPAIMITSGARGLLEGIQRFEAVAAGRFTIGIVGLLAPCALCLLGYRSASAAIAAIVFARIGAMLLHLWLCVKLFPALRQCPIVRRSDIIHLATTGAWLTISNIISPLMVSFDRFIVVKVMSAAAVAYYATPVDTLGRLLVIPGAMSSVSFVMFAKTRTSDLHHRQVYERALCLTTGLLGPILLCISLFAKELIGLWLGTRFAVESYKVTQIICIGVFINALASTPYSLIQGLGKMRTTAQLHLLEIAIYAPTCWWLIEYAGITGAAIAWTLRILVDAAALFLIASRQCADLRALSGSVLGITTVLAISSIVPIDSVIIRSILCFAVAVHGARSIVTGAFAMASR